MSAGTRSLLLTTVGAVLLAASAAHAQTAHYQWVSASAPPAHTVTAPDSPHKLVCRAKGMYDRLWAGYWDGSSCIGSDAGNKMPASTDLQFLTLVSGTNPWFSNTGKRWPGEVGTLPANAVNAGNTYFNSPQVLCSQGGYVGWVWSNQCSISGAGSHINGQQNASVLVGIVD